LYSKIVAASTTPDAEGDSGESPQAFKIIATPTRGQMKPRTDRMESTSLRMAQLLQPCERIEKGSSRIASHGGPHRISSGLSIGRGLEDRMSIVARAIASA
jgi:hypothetical protein